VQFIVYHILQICITLHSQVALAQGQEANEFAPVCLTLSWLLLSQPSADIASQVNLLNYIVCKSEFLRHC
jgi:hypothetical protein